MRLIWCLLVVLTSLLASMFWLMSSIEPIAVTGSAHPEIAAMRIGGDGLARLGDQAWVLAGLQYLSLGVIYLLIALGVAPHRRTRLFWALLGIGFALSIVICWLMMSSYFQYLADGSVAMLLGFPVPTTLMLYAIFLGGSYLCWLYCWGFHRFIFTAEDAAEYEALLADTKHLRSGDKR